MTLTAVGGKPACCRFARPDLLFSWCKCVWLVRARRLPRVFRSYLYYAASTDDASVYRKRRLDRSVVAEVCDVQEDSVATSAGRHVQVRRSAADRDCVLPVVPPEQPHDAAGGRQVADPTRHRSRTAATVHRVQLKSAAVAIPTRAPWRW
jgi:hypothetical protein